MPLTIHTNNLVSLDGKYIGRIDRETFAMKSANPNIKTTFFTPTNGDRTALNTPHEISEPLYIGGPSSWKINPAFESQVRAIIKGATQ